MSRTAVRPTTARTTTARRATLTALGAAAALSVTALAPAASALTTEDIPLVNGHRQGHVAQGVHKTEITHPVHGTASPIEFRPLVGCMGPGQVEPAGEPREGIFLATDDMTPRSPGLGSLDPYFLIPTSDTLTVSWTNHTTGQSGETVRGGQGLRTEARINTGTGHVTGTAVLATSGPLGGLGAGSLGGGAGEARYDFDFHTVPCTP